jgi:hypothetical protein
MTILELGKPFVSCVSWSRVETLSEWLMLYLNLPCCLTNKLCGNPTRLNFLEQKLHIQF